jgi:quinol monooxygenase YgiN
MQLTRNPERTILRHNGYEHMHAVLTIIRYKKRFIYFALMAMALHRLPLRLNRRVRFYKLLGCGKGGTFSKTPDWQQWAILVVMDKEDLDGINDKRSLLQRAYGRFICGWWKLFGCQTSAFLLEPVEGHGKWDGKEAFGPLPHKSDYEGPIAVLTRATISSSKRSRFWEHVEAVANEMRKAEGFQFSVGIGENPWTKQATFSVWESKEHMKQFAYKMPNHAEVIQKTRKEKWYSEDMFVRFKVLGSWGYGV